MHGFLKKLACKVGLTEIEIKVLFFMLLTFLGGYSYRFVTDLSVHEVKTSDYSALESFFNEKIENNTTFSEKNLAYNSEVLDFSKTNFNFTNKISLGSGEKINLNSAGKIDLMKLPGIGEKTAEKIIEYRNNFGKFRHPQDIMNVKGIGEKKFEKLKSFIIIN
jgi:comEA protein